MFLLNKTQFSGGLLAFTEERDFLQHTKAPRLARQRAAQAGCVTPADVRCNSQGANSPKMYREGACETRGIPAASFMTQMRNAEATRHQISLGFEQPPGGALPEPLAAAGLGGPSGLEP